MQKRSVKRPQIIQPADPSYRLIPLTLGEVAKVDAEDYEWLNQWNWQAVWDPKKKSCYARRTTLKGGYRNFLMHREILKCDW